MGRSGGRHHLGKNTNITSIARPRPQKTTSVDAIGCQHDHDDDDDDDADNCNDIGKDNGNESDTDTKINTAGACNNLGRSDEGASNPKHEGNWRPTHCRGIWQQFCADICRRACGGVAWPPVAATEGDSRASFQGLGFKLLCPTPGNCCTYK